MAELSKLAKFQRIRLQRIAMAAGTYAFVLLVAYLIQSVKVGSLPNWLWVFMIISATAANAFFAYLVLTGRNLKFSDPAMTRLQIIFSALWGMLGVLALPEARPLVLMLFLASFMFGAMSLKRRKYIELVGVISSILAIGLLLEYTYLRPEMNIAFEFLVWSCFSLTMLWFAFFGSYLYSTKKKLRESKSQLEQTQNDLRAATKQLQRAADTDYLTGVLNRRAFYQNVAALETKSNTNHIVILQDIDHFKAINDEFGHDIGDAVLVEVVKRIHQILRPGDILSRWGGEEFMVLLTNVDFETAQKVAERIRANFETNPIVLADHTVSITISQGVVQLNTLDNLDKAIKQADELLYLAKRRGRNRLELASAQY